MISCHPGRSEGAASRERTAQAGPSLRSRRRLRSGRLLLVTLLACASPGAPPGGAPDKLPPKLLEVVPESGQVRVAPRSAIFRFDEVVSERPSGAAKLEDMFIVSPRGRGVDVDWNREEVWIRPQGGWRKDLVYTITMLPGMADLRGNVLKEGRTLVFATGATIYDTQLAGMLFDWVKGTPAPLTLVEAVDRRDTTIQYVGLTDSIGRFNIRHLPPATYLVRSSVASGSSIGSTQGPSLRGFDRRRAWDTLAVVLNDSARVELLAFVHDTLGPRVSALVVRDSLTLKLTLDQPIPAAQRLSPENFVLLTRDSTPLGIEGVFSAEAFAKLEKAAADSAAAAKARADSVAAKARADSVARADTTRRAPAAAARPDSARRPGAPANTPPVNAPPASVARGVRQPAPAPITVPPAAAPAPSATPTTPTAPSSAGARPLLTRADSVADSTRRVLPKPSQPLPISEFVIRLAVPLAPQSSFRLVLQDIRGLLGASRKSDRAFATPKPPSKDSTAAARGAGAAGAPGSAPQQGPRPPGFTPTKPPSDSAKSPKPPEAFDRP